MVVLLDVLGAEVVDLRCRDLPAQRSRDSLVHTMTRHKVMDTAHLRIDSVGTQQGHMVEGQEDYSDS